MQEAHAQHQGTDQVERPAHVNHVGQQADSEQYQGVKQDVHLGVVLAVGHRQHRNIRLGVLFLAVNGQGPEVWRGPGENDQHQQQRLGADMTTDRHPAQQRRRRAGQAANHDVLRRGPLEKAGIDHRITEQRGQGQPGGEGVGKDQQQGHAQQRQQQGKGQSRGRRYPAFGQGTLVGAGHQRIDAPVHHVVDHCGAAGTTGDTEVAEQQDGPGHARASGEKHTDQGRDQHQHHDLGLGQLQVVAPACLEPASA
ncbi:hypothetical protein D3C79_726220 [compost metagenome]